MSQQAEHHPIIPREALDFQLDAKDIPKYWFGGDPFKTRFFDALSHIFPPGERYFMTSVRDFRDRVDDPVLLQDIKDFNRQEGQHTRVHAQYNARVTEQGVDSGALIKSLEWLLFDVYRKMYSREYTLAHTAALEHFTAIGAFMLFGRQDLWEQADPRVRAMYVWHALEEVEHKGVAYDVMQKYAKVGYLRRVVALLEATIMFPAVIVYFMHKMLVADGFSFFQRAKIMAKGTWWLFKPSGLLAPMLLPYFRYFKPGYHPWEEGEIPGYQVWLSEFKRSRDPVRAGNAILEMPGATLATS